MSWKDKTQVKKGDIGEEIIVKYLQENNYKVYQPISEGSHPFDGFALKYGKLFMFDVKTKARMNKCNCTGFDYKHYKLYKQKTKELDLNFYVYFVDDKNGDVYMADILKLEKVEKTKMQWFTRSIIGWDLSLLDFLFNIGKDKIEQLSQFDTRKHKYEPK